MEIFPEKNKFYKETDIDNIFEVVGIHADTIYIQYLNGELEIINIDIWESCNIETVDNYIEKPSEDEYLYDIYYKDNDVSSNENLEFNINNFE